MSQHTVEVGQVDAKDRRLSDSAALMSPPAPHAERCLGWDLFMKVKEYIVFTVQASRVAVFCVLRLRASQLMRQRI